MQLRKKIINQLFNRYVSEDEKAFSSELYMNTDQIKCMIKNGMYVGGHGYDHFWLDQLSHIQQKNEIEKTIDFLNVIGSSTKKWIMCYPYGAYNKQLIELLRQKNCALGLTTKVGMESLVPDNAFTLERFDTNDLQRLVEGKSNVISDQKNG